MKPTKFPCRIYIKEYAVNDRGDNDFFWKSLCVVYDNEALGLIERLLQRSEIEYKVERHDGATMNRWPDRTGFYDRQD